ncbi:MAG: ABC transporter ATP-binding protein [Gemmatimonadota bacterium]|nr:MAG: ABC transporter ATP-binding protein [Gemmatimonadota bacterium]
MPKDKASPGETLGFLRRLLPRLRPYRLHLVVAGFLMLFSTGVGLAFPLFVGTLIDAASATLLNSIALALIGLFSIQAVVNFSQSYLTASVSERVVAELRNDIFRALVHQPPGFFADRRVGELTSRVASDAGLIQGVLRFGVPELIRQGVFLVGALVLVTIANPRLTLVTLTAIPFAVLVGWFFGRRVRRISTSIQDRLAAAVARAEQVFTQIRTVQSFTRESWETDLYGAEVNAARDEGLRRAVARASLTGIVTFVAFGAIVLVIWEGGRLVLEGELTYGQLVTFLLYAVTISGAITSLAGFWGNVQEAAGAAKRIFEILDTPITIVTPAAPTQLPDPPQGAVRYEGVSFRYGPDLPLVLREIDLIVEAGETVAIVGSSGVGKSTLVSLLPRFFDVEDGRVTLDGIDVRDAALEELRQRIGFVPQEPMLFAGTVRENLLYGDLEATDAEIEEVSRAAHAYDFITAFPDGFDQAIGERGVTLSAGQRQRIAIARVMLERPKILILDEASSSLDAESEGLVQDALERLMTDRTTLVIAHRLSTVIRAERILVLDAGVIAEEGTHTELLQQSQVYDRLYRRQFEDALATTEVGESA